MNPIMTAQPPQFKAHSYTHNATSKNTFLSSTTQFNHSDIQFSGSFKKPGVIASSLAALALLLGACSNDSGSDTAPRASASSVSEATNNGNGTDSISPATTQSIAETETPSAETNDDASHQESTPARQFIENMALNLGNQSYAQGAKLEGNQIILTHNDGRVEILEVYELSDTQVKVVKDTGVIEIHTYDAEENCWHAEIITPSVEDSSHQESTPARQFIENMALNLGNQSYAQGAKLEGNQIVLTHNDGRIEILEVYELSDTQVKVVKDTGVIEIHTYDAEENCWHAELQ